MLIELTNSTDEEWRFAISAKVTDYQSEPDQAIHYQLSMTIANEHGEVIHSELADFDSESESAGLSLLHDLSESKSDVKLHTEAIVYELPPSGKKKVKARSSEDYILFGTQKSLAPPKLELSAIYEHDPINGVSNAAVGVKILMMARDGYELVAICPEKTKLEYSVSGSGLIPYDTEAEFQGNAITFPVGKGKEIIPGKTGGIHVVATVRALVKDLSEGGYEYGLTQITDSCKYA